MHTPQYGTLDILLDKVVVVVEGKIKAITAGSEEANMLEIWGVPASSVRRLKVMLQSSATDRTAPCSPGGMWHQLTAGWRVHDARPD